MQKNYFLKTDLNPSFGRKSLKAILLFGLITLSGSMAWSQNGAALHFDGSNDVVNLGTSLNTVLDPLNTITVEAWVKPESTTFNGVIVGNYATSNSSQMQFLLRRDSNSYTFWIGNDGAFTAVATGNIVALNTWQHIVGVWDGADLRIYVNGVLQGTTVGVGGSSFDSTTNNVVIGGDYYGQPEMFAGVIDEVRIWNRALPVAEILNNMNCELPSGQTGLLAYYNFNAGIAGASNLSADQLTDYSGNNITGALVNFTLDGTASNWVANGGVGSGVACPVYLGAADFEKAAVLLAYPNPFEHFTTVVLDADAEVTLYDVVGKKIFSKSVKAGSTSMDMGSYPVGVYLLKMTTAEQKTKTIKLIKQ